MKKIRLVGIKEASTEFGVIQRDQIVEVSDRRAELMLQQIGMWEAADDEKTTKQTKGIQK